MTDKISRLSASGIKSFRDCEKQFYYKYVSDVESPDREEPEFFAVGNTVHDSIEKVLKENDIPALDEDGILKLLRDKERSLDHNYEDTEKVQTCLEFASKYIGKYVEKVVSVEDKFTMNLKGIDFIGYADLISDIQRDDEEYNDVIIDWKTGKVNEDWKEKIQGGMYAKMYRENEGRWPDAIHFVYLSEDTLSVHNRVDDGEVMWNDHQNKYWDEISADISDISNAMFNDEWEANVTDNCYWCDYKYACSDYVGSEGCEPHHLDIEGLM